MQVGNFSLPAEGALWETSYMPEPKELRGKSLYDALVALKPDDLAETAWAEEAGVNRGFFSNLKKSDISPRRDTIRKVLHYIGKTESDLDQQPEVEPNAKPIHFEGASFARMKQDVPIVGTGLGADRIEQELAIEQTHLYSDEIIGYAKRPVILDGRADIYGLYVQGSSMDPAFCDGDLVFVEMRRPPRIGDNVVVYLRRNGDEDEGDDGSSARMVMIKRLVRRTGQRYDLEQHNPRLTFSIERDEVLKIHRVVPFQELLS